MGSLRPNGEPLQSIAVALSEIRNGGGLSSAQDALPARQETSGAITKVISHRCGRLGLVRHELAVLSLVRLMKLAGVSVSLGNSKYLFERYGLVDCE